MIPNFTHIPYKYLVFWSSHHPLFLKLQRTHIFLSLSLQEFFYAGLREELAQKALLVSVWDYDLGTADDFIGEQKHRVQEGASRALRATNPFLGRWGAAEWQSQWGTPAPLAGVPRPL